MKTISSMIFEESNIFYSLSVSNDNKCKHSKKIIFKIPIVQKIDSFGINSYIIVKKISLSNQYILAFQIHSKKLRSNNVKYYKFFGFEKKIHKLSINKIDYFIDKIKTILPRLFFDKLSGLFKFKSNSTVDSSNIINAVNNSDSSNLSNKFDKFESSNKFGDCCVCYDKTSTTTSCSHFLCVECWTQIKNKCPYCRTKNITIKKKSLSNKKNHF